MAPNYCSSKARAGAAARASADGLLARLLRHGSVCQPTAHDLAGQSAHHGLGDFDLSVEHGVHQLAHRHEVDVEELVVIGARALE